MKKSMFITAVIMVIVVAVALTTSSLAWFSASSSTTVSLTSMSLSAKGESSEGLLITKDITSAAWSSGSISLTPGALETYKPVVPSTEDGATLTTASTIVALGAETFIGNKTKTENSTLVWSGSAYGSASGVVADTCWYSDDLYIANAGDKAVHIQADIKFSNRHGATLFVAVMAWNETNSAWELIRLESSAGSNAGTVVTSLMVGRGVDYFAEDEPVASAYAGVSPGTLSQTSETLAARDISAAWGGTKRFKVVAWYAADLYNGNSGAYDADDNANGTTNEVTVEFSIPEADLL